MKAHKLKILMIILIMISCSTYSQNEWQIYGEMPLPVSGGKAVVINDAIYILGGYSDSLKSNVNYIQVFYPYQNKWELAGFLQENRHGLFAGNFENNILICGGIDGETSDQASLQILLQDSTGFSFSSDSSFKYNRKYSSGHIYDGKLYLIGGYSDATVPDTSDKAYILEYGLFDNATAFRITERYKEFEFPVQQMSAIIDSDIYIFGGSYNGILSKINSYNTINHTYEQLSLSLFEPRAGGDAVSIFDKDIYLIGGYNENSNALSSVEKIIVNTGFYLQDQLPPLNYARKDLMAVNFDNQIYVFGGKDKDDRVVRYIEILIPEFATEVEEKNLPLKFELYPNYPNPFNPGTIISFRMPENSQVTLRIYSVLGELVKSVEDAFLAPGTYKYYWDGSDNSGNMVSNGIYLSRLDTGNKSFFQKMLLLK